MQIIKLQAQGGLCNRLRAIISASLWAEDIGCDLWIYWPIQPGHMACSLEEILIPGSISRCKKVVDNELYDSIEIQTVEAAMAESDGLAAIKSYSIFHPDFHGPRGRCLLRSLRLRPEVEAAADSIWKSIGGASNWIGIHIRQTDHAKCIEASPLEAFEILIKELQEKNKQQKFLLVSDDAAVLDRFGKENIFRHRFPLGRQDKIQQIHGVIDWILLQKVGVVIGSATSSFSELAAWRSGAELKNP